MTLIAKRSVDHFITFYWAEALNDYWAPNSGGVQIRARHKGDVRLGEGGIIRRGNGVGKHGRGRPRRGQALARHFRSRLAAIK